MNGSTFTSTCARRMFVAVSIAVVASFAHGVLLTTALAQNPPAVLSDHSDANDELPEIETPVTNTPRPFNPHDPIKGRRSRRAGGYLGAVAGARLSVEHQMLINNVNHANQLYRAETGGYPKSHEEFMEKIITANGLHFPELEPGHEYIYVPDQPEVGLQIRLKQSELKQATDAEQAIAGTPEMMPAGNACESVSHLDGVAPACRFRKASRKFKRRCWTPQWHAICNER